jgi:hypothetical protein
MAATGAIDPLNDHGGLELSEDGSRFGGYPRTKLHRAALSRLARVRPATGCRVRRRKRGIVARLVVAPRRSIKVLRTLNRALQRRSYSPD